MIGGAVLSMPDQLAAAEIRRGRMVQGHGQTQGGMISKRGGGSVMIALHHRQQGVVLGVMVGVMVAVSRPGPGIGDQTASTPGPKRVSGRLEGITGTKGHIPAAQSNLFEAKGPVAMKGSQEADGNVVASVETGIRANVEKPVGSAGRLNNRLHW